MPSQVQADVVGGRRVAFHVGQLVPGNGELVMDPRVELLELVDPVEDVPDELLQEDPRGDADLPAQVTADGLGEVADVSLVGHRPDPYRIACSGGVQVPDLQPELDEALRGEARQPDLYGARVVEARV